MGTSLSGLTPATTFDGLLKVGDNDPLTADLKAISTGDGTDTILQLSNTSLLIQGTDGSYDTISLDIKKSSGQSLFKVRNRGALEIGGGIDLIDLHSNNNGIRFNVSSSEIARVSSTGLGVGVAPSARLHIKGSGATSATTSLLVQNSAGSELLKVTDDGVIDFGLAGLEMVSVLNGGTLRSVSNREINITQTTTEYSTFFSHKFETWDGSAYSEAMRITGNTDQFVGIGETTPTARLHLKGSGNDNTTTSLLVQNSDATELLKVTDDATLDVSGTLTIQRSSANFAMRLGNEQRINGFIDAGQTNILSLLSAAGGGNNVYITPTGIGVNQSTPTAKLQVKGSGATSATTALLVQNSAGTDYLSVKDNGEFFAGTGYNKIVGSGNNLYLDFIALNYRIGAGNTVAKMTTAGLQIGNGASNPTARLQVKGSGATIATTALLVQNSAGADLFKINDFGAAEFIGNVSSNRFYARLGFYHSDNTNNALSPSSTTGWVLQTANATGNIQVKNVNVTASKETTAALQVDSTTQGFLPPRMTTTERDAISTPAAGLMVYNTTTNKAQCYNGTAWQDLF